MIDDKMIIYVKLEDGKLFFRNVNRKIISHICELANIPIYFDDTNKSGYISNDYLDTFLNVMSTSSFHLMIL